MANVVSDKHISVLDLLNGKSEKFADRTALCIRDGEGWRSLTYAELSLRARRLASYLIEAGIKKGDRVALLSESRPEWGVALFGSIRSGAITVPLDIKLTESELTIILSDCAPRVVLVDAKHKDVIDNVRKKVTSIEHVFLVDDQGDEQHPSIKDLEPKSIQSGIERQVDEVALIVYTSGTTGNPKGVMTTFGNLIFQVNSFEDMFDLSADDRFLSILPLNHLLELTGGFLGVLNQGGMICFCHSLFPKEVLKTMKDKQITGLIAVPLFYKSIRSGIESEIKRSGEADLERFRGGLGKAAALPMEARKKLFAQIHERLGGSLRGFICGGAPLEIEVAEFFDRMGIPILQGYGLTETSPVISGNTLRQNKLGSIGKPLPGLEVKIDLKDKSDTDGEILTRGPHLMKGYYKREDLTNEVIDSDGWFHTGDIGHLDKDGFLFITGRIKNLIVLGGGKKIFPEEVEAVLSNSPTLKEICVLGHKSSDGFKEGTEEVCAVVVPSDALVHQYKDDTPGMQKAIKEDLDKLGENLASYKRPTRIYLHTAEFEKTATRKIKRAAVSNWLANQ